ncbi:AAA family ATPase [Lysobacter sp. F60174L2]|uniref:AAA family ATPase n=1 Tax=Lysobacter sp. F60174L2 TaxID=3459295 RepID=UPI00403D632A
MSALKFKGYRCFTSDWAGFDSLSLINIIIGRNNTGKSQLIDLVRFACKDKLPIGPSFRCMGCLDEASLRPFFPENVSQGNLGGNHWQNHGVHFIGLYCTWESEHGQIKNLTIDSEPLTRDSVVVARRKQIEGIVGRATPPFSGKSFRHILADRDIRTEPASQDMKLASDGTGATNIIRRFILSSSTNLPRDVIQVELLEALNIVFGSDGCFTEIQVQQHDEDTSDGVKEHWEVYLGEARKGLVALSRSGSGLKTVMLVLLNLIAVPKIEGKERSRFVFAFEELENNLHPALLRRLLCFIEEYVKVEDAHVFLTTHSGVALDQFSASGNAQIVHVSHDGSSARTATVAAHLDRLGIVAELGAKPSDLLQANGIVWVEGPSDCVYLNAWIKEVSRGELREGRDYLCAFYGGSLLARTQFTCPEDAEDELVNLLHVNANLAVVCDSDRDAPKKHLKARVRRIREEVDRIPGALIWVTEPKEIENYLPGTVIAAACGMDTLPDPSQFQTFFPRAGGRGESYVEKMMGRKSIDKIELAASARRYMTTESMMSRFDWLARMESLVATIRRWNA